MIAEATTCLGALADCYAPRLPEPPPLLWLALGVLLGGLAVSQ